VTVGHVLLADLQAPEDIRLSLCSAVLLYSSFHSTPHSPADAQAREEMPRWYCLCRLGSSFSSSPAEASCCRASCITIVSRSRSSTCSGHATSNTFVPGHQLLPASQ
jgi:hypothetical protein